MNQILKFAEKIKSMLNSNNKKKILENTIIIIIIGIIIIIAGGYFFRNDSVKSSSTIPDEGQNVQAAAKNNLQNEKTDIEVKMEKILSEISGAGKVSVMVTFYSGSELVPATDSKKTENDTQEKDATGGTRNIRQYDMDNKIIFEESQGGSKKPVIIKEILPQVKGVVVVADGAADLQVNDRLCRAVQVLLDVPLHRIQVFQRKSS